MKKPVADAASRAPVVLVADGGLRRGLPPSNDPIADWIDLMDAVEILCPEWPAREVSPVTAVYRL